MSDSRPFGFDTGWFKVKGGNAREHNFDALDAWRGTPKEPKFALIEFSDGLWNEPDAGWYVEECERKGLRWGSWHFLRKKASVSEQVKKWLQTPRSPFFPRQIDYERSRLDGTIPNASELLEACRRMEDAEGRPVIIYSRVQLVVDFLATMRTEDLNARWWWLAQYLANQTVQGEDPGPVRLHIIRGGKRLESRILPERVLIHQTADHLSPPPGFTPNAKSMDYDRWCGPMALEDFSAGGTNPVPLSLEQRVARLEQEARAHGWVLT